MEPSVEEAGMQWPIGTSGPGRFVVAVLAPTIAGLAIGGCVIVDRDTSDPGATDPTVVSVTLPTATSSTTTDAPADAPMSIHLTGPATAFTADAAYTVEGWVNRGSVVEVGPTTVEAIADPNTGVANFGATIELEATGTHEIAVIATDATTAEVVSMVVEIVFDPDMDTPVASIEEVDRDDRTITFDEVEWLTGDEAVDAARADGEISGDQDLPNDFYIRNEDRVLRTLPLAAGATATLQVCHPDGGPCVVEETIDADDWMALADDPQSAESTHGWFWYGANDSPYRITIRDGLVVHVAEFYVP
jgi:hypothetical protein